MFTKFKLTEYSKSNYWFFSFSVSNPREYYESGHLRTDFCNLHFAIFGHSWWFRIPELFKPKKTWVDRSKDMWPKAGYWDYTSKRYGISVTDDSIHLSYGIQPGSWSSTDKKNSDHTKVFWIPWKNMTFQYKEFYTPVWKSIIKVYPKNKSGALDFEKLRNAEDNVPKIKFKFNDYDGKEIIATCYIHKMVWRHGVGWCKWLGYIRKPVVQYRLNIDFSDEVGYNKGSWKGGTMSHSGDLQYGEQPLNAFIRYGTSNDQYKDYGTKNRGFSNIIEVHNE